MRTGKDKANQGKILGAYFEQEKPKKRQKMIV
jgi:hypothetical protein